MTIFPKIKKWSFNNLVRGIAPLGAFFFFSQPLDVDDEY
jgi:hypothetical protein